MTAYPGPFNAHKYVWPDQDHCQVLSQRGNGRVMPCGCPLFAWPNGQVCCARGHEQSPNYQVEGDSQ